MIIGLGATSTQSVQQMIVQAANQYGVPPAMALGVAAHESGFNPGALNQNTNGTTDYGVMQLNTATVKTLGVADPMDPQQNINAGVSLLGKYLQQYNGDESKALWAYASGPGAVAAGNQNSTAAQFISYVTSYSPDLSVYDPTAGAVNTALDTSSLLDPLSTAATDFGTAFSSGSLDSVSSSDWMMVGGGLAILMGLAYFLSKR